MTLFRVLKAELLKNQKNWPLLVAILSPLCQVMFLAIIMWYSEDRVVQFRPGFKFWHELNFMAWNLCFMPISAALISALSWQTEDNARSWNHLMAQPVDPFMHYLAKLLIHYFLLLFSLFLLMLTHMPTGWILQKNPNLLMGPPLWKPLFIMGGYSILAMLPVVCFQTWLAMHFRGLWISLLIAMLGTWICVQWGGNTFVQVFPWGLSAQAVLVFERWRSLPWIYIPGALGCATLWGALGAFRFSIRLIR